MSPLHRFAMLACLLALPLASQAATQTYSLSGVLDSGHYAGESYSGQLSYDDSALLGSGSEYLGLGSLFLSFLGQAYTAADAAAPAEVAFLDGSFLGLSYTVEGASLQFSFVPGMSALGEAFVAYDTSAGLSGAGSAIYAPVPEPGSSSMLLAGLGLIGILVSRRLKS